MPAFMKRGELAELRQMREAGVVSFFRVAACQQCGTEVIKGKRFCRAQCAEAHAQEVEMFDNLNGLVNRKVKIETSDGCYRSGVLSSVIWHQVTVGDGKLSVPSAIRLDNEPGDELPWHRLVSVIPA